MNGLTALGNWSIKQKLVTIGFLAIIGIVSILLPVLNLGNVLSQEIHKNEKRNGDVVQFEKLVETLGETTLIAMDLIINVYEDSVTSAEYSELQEAVTELLSHKVLLSQLKDSEYEQTIARSASGHFSKLEKLFGELIEAAKNNDKTSLRRLDDEIDSEAEKLSVLMDGFHESLHTEADVASKIMLQTLNDTRNSIVEIGFVVVLVLVVSLVGLVRSVVAPLSMMTKGMGQLASKDLSAVIPGVGRKDELGQMANAIELFKTNMIKADEDKEQENQHLVKVTSHLKQVIDAVAGGDLTVRAVIDANWNQKLVSLAKNLNKMIENLAAVTRQIHEASDAMATSLAEVRSAMLSQSSSSTQQASAINETTSTLSEIKATSNQTLEKALSQSGKAEKARVDSQSGNKAVTEAVQGMDKIHRRMDDVAASILELSRKTQQITEITDVVDDLARQSKMLALNASIEAARAGESGQGFAVVAEEIRNLAEQSRESTAQVKTILQDIRSSTEHTVMVAEEGTKQVSEGSRLIEDAGKAINALNVAVDSMAMESQQITAAVRQETSGIEQISTAMTEISSATNNSVASIRQTETAVEDLSKLSGKLKDQVRIYRV